MLVTQLDAAAPIWVRFEDRPRGFSGARLLPVFDGHGPPRRVYCRPAQPEVAVNVVEWGLEQFQHHIATLKESSRTEGAKRDLTMAIDESTRGLTVATAGDSDVERLAARAEFLAAKNKYMLRAETWTVLGIDVSDGDRVGYFHLVLDDPWQQDGAMDQLAEETLRRINEGTSGGFSCKASSSVIASAHGRLGADRAACGPDPPAAGPIERIDHPSDPAEP